MPEKLEEVNRITAKALDELRSLSRSLNKGTYGQYAGLQELVLQEVQLIEKTGVIRPHVKISGKVYTFDADHEIICFRIMQEFVSNALKYSGCENIYFRLDYQPGMFGCCVSDDGKGFIEGQIVKGNGLINIENRARMIGAEYELKSVPGKGTKITLQLKTQLNPYSIVLVDDHLVVSEAIAGLINALPQYRILYEARNGRELVQKFADKKNIPDIVLLDINMPIMNGFETAQWLQQNHPDVLFLALTMNDDEESIIKMLRAGAKGYLIKDTDTGSACWLHSMK